MDLEIPVKNHLGAVQISAAEADAVPIPAGSKQIARSSFAQARSNKKVKPLLRPIPSTTTPITSKDVASGPHQGHSGQGYRSTVTKGADSAPECLRRYRRPLWRRRCMLPRVVCTNDVY